MIKSCEICGDPFSAPRGPTKFCGPVCARAKATARDKKRRDQPGIRDAANARERVRYRAEMAEPGGREAEAARNKKRKALLSAKARKYDDLVNRIGVPL